MQALTPAKKVLVIVDTQKDFMDPAGALYAQGAEAIGAPFNSYLASLSADDFDFVLIVMDTHSADDFRPGFKPLPHCLYGTWGWELAIKAGNISKDIPLFVMTKNMNDMWSEAFAISKEMPPQLFQVRKTAACGNILMPEDPGQPRDCFMDNCCVGPGTEISAAGLLSNFCIQDALLGFLRRGCSISALEDFCHGIKVTPRPDRAASGSIRDVLNLGIFKPYREAGLVKITKTAGPEKIIDNMSSWSIRTVRLS